MRTIFFFTFLLFLTACSSIDCPVQNLVETQYALMDAYDNPDILDTDTLNICLNIDCLDIALIGIRLEDRGTYRCYRILNITNRDFLRNWKSLQ